MAVKIFHAKIKNPGSKDRALGYPLRGLNGFSHLAVVCWSGGVMESMKSQTPSTMPQGFRCKVSGVREEKQKH
ncbi:MAG: hypothetical protein GWN93_21085 [Deltaproteobacteria bacterium]|nr:hypothetical protein [Deltaproteobacteria bacterium]